MERKHKIKRILLGSLVLAFASVLTVSCNKNNDTPKISPKYILSGDKKDTDSIYDYYDLGNGELAISLTDAAKESYPYSASDPLTIPTSHTYSDNGETVTKPVTGIWHNAFHGCPATSITLSAGITVIDFEAFLSSGITSITIPYTIISNILVIFITHFFKHIIQYNQFFFYPFSVYNSPYKYK